MIFNFTLRIGHVVCGLTISALEPPAPMLQTAFCSIDCQSVPRLR